MFNSVLFPLLAFFVAADVLTITPDVETATVLHSSTVGGNRAGVAAGLGICGGLLVCGVGAAFRLTTLLEWYDADGWFHLSKGFLPTREADLG